jgi:phage protein U
MLMQLGGLQFMVAPFNAHELDQKTGADFAEHPVLGRPPAPEFVGEATEEIDIHGKLYPQRLGGLSELATLQAMSRSGESYFFMRGDGVPMGWFNIHSMHVKSTYLDAAGVGRVIDFNAKLKRADAPGAGGIFGLLLSLFGS